MSEVRASHKPLTGRVSGLDNKAFFTPVRLAYIAIFVLSIALYSRTVNFLPVWDDNQIFQKQAFGGGSLWGVFTKPFLGHYFRPLTSLSYWIDFQLGNTTPFIWHQTNILLHAAAVIVVGLLARVITNQPWAGICASIVFAVQPSQIAPTAWVGARTDVLSTLALALFLLTLVKYLQSTDRRWLVTSSVLLLVCALVKEQNLAVLAVVPFAFWWHNKDKTIPRTPLVIALLAPTMVFIVLWLQFAHTAYRLLPPTLGETIARTGGTAVHYSAILLVPTTQAQATLSLANYENTLIVLAGYGILIALVALVAVGFSRRSVAGLAGIIGLALYLPVSNAIPMPSLLVGPYRVASVGIAVALTLGAWAESAIRARRFGQLAIAAGVVAIWGASVVTTTPIWRSEESFFTEVARRDPWSTVGRLNAIATEMKGKRYQEAVSLVDTYLDWAADGADWRSDVESGKGVTLTGKQSRRVRTSTGVQGETETYLSSFLRHRGTALEELGHHAAAVGSLESAVLMDPKSGPALFQLAEVVLATDRPRAIGLYKRSAELYPTNTVYTRLGHALMDSGDFGGAADAFREALKLSDWIGDLWIDLAECEVKNNQYFVAHDAIERAKTLLVLDKGRLARVEQQVQDLKKSTPGSN